MGEYAFYQTYITGLTIDNSVTKIGNYAFGKCQELIGDITIHCGVENIGNCVFFRTGIAYIGNDTFSNCKKTYW